MPTNKPTFYIVSEQEIKEQIKNTLNYLGEEIMKDNVSEVGYSETLEKSMTNAPNYTINHIRKTIVVEYDVMISKDDLKKGQEFNG